MSDTTGTSSTDVNGISAGSPGSMPDFSNFNLTAAQGNDDLTRIITCFLQTGENEYNGNLGARISALFVIMIISTCATAFPVLATRIRRLKIPVYVYLFARYFGSGVIVATGFIHLLDPAYSEIGPQTCVGMTGGWADYSWCPALALASCMITFFVDFAAERYVEAKYGLSHGGEMNVEAMITKDQAGHTGALNPLHEHHDSEHDTEANRNHDLALAQSRRSGRHASNAGYIAKKEADIYASDTDSDVSSMAIENAFRTQIAAFLVLEFGVIFHSVIIGLALGSAGDEFSTLYPVLVFHQSFEGLGIGARLSAIPFPNRLKWMPWALVIAYGLTTPIAIAVGLGVRTQYNAGSYTANVVSGVLDALSAGILLYTGLVELLARDFLFDPHRTKDGKKLAFMCCSVLLGVFLMALLGEWA